MPDESPRHFRKIALGGKGMNRIAIIGGGPAGLRAAEVAAQSAQVTLFDAKASVGRKFLVAGKGGLNITKSEDFSYFAKQYQGSDFPEPLWTQMLREFDPEALRQWAAGLGVETFVASTGRVYPREMKAAPLLRRWVQRLRDNGVVFKLHHRWSGARTKQGFDIPYIGGGRRSSKPTPLFSPSAAGRGPKPVPTDHGRQPCEILESPYHRWNQPTAVGKWIGLPPCLPR